MFKRIAELLPDLTTFIIVALLFGVIRVLLMPEKRGFKEIVTVFIICAPVGALVGWACLGNVPDPIALMACAVSSLLSETIVLSILKNSDFLIQLLKRAAENLTDKWTK